MIPGTAMFVFVGTTLKNLADALRGDVSGAEGGSTIQSVMLIVGLIFTIVSTVFITVIAKRKLNSYVKVADEARAAEGAADAGDTEKAPLAVAPTMEPEPQALEPEPEPAPPAPMKMRTIALGCTAGWLLLAGCIVALTALFLYKAKVEFVPEDPGGEIFVNATTLKEWMDAGEVNTGAAAGVLLDRSHVVALEWTQKMWPPGVSPNRTNQDRTSGHPAGRARGRRLQRRLRRPHPRRAARAVEALHALHRRRRQRRVAVPRREAAGRAAPAGRAQRPPGRGLRRLGERVGRGGPAVLDAGVPQPHARPRALRRRRGPRAARPRCRVAPPRLRQIHPR
jgi:hypothetical protein